MKRSRTRSAHRPDRPARPLRRIRAAGLAATLAAFASLTAGCVSAGSYQKVVDERDALRDEKEQLAESVATVEAERTELNEQLDDLRIQQQELERERTRLAGQKAELESSLRTRENEVTLRPNGSDALKGTYEGLVQDLEAEVSAGQIEIERLSAGLRVNLSEDILFPSGSAELSAAGQAVIAKVAEQIVKVPDRVQVQGHTDSIPIAGALATRFPSNWELGGARAAAVVRWLAESGVEGDRLSAVSFAEFAPVASNDTPEGRALNRRIEIRLLPVEAGASPSP